MVTQSGGGKGGEVHDQVSYENEHDKPSTPSKEELELNERNLTKEAATPATRLGKLHFKLRWVFVVLTLVFMVLYGAHFGLYGVVGLYGLHFKFTWVFMVLTLLFMVLI